MHDLWNSVSFQVDIFVPAIKDKDMFILMLQICRLQTRFVSKIRHQNLTINLLQLISLIDLVLGCQLDV